MLNLERVIKISDFLPYIGRKIIFHPYPDRYDDIVEVEMVGIDLHHCNILYADTNRFGNHPLYRTPRSIEPAFTLPSTKVYIIKDGLEVLYLLSDALHDKGFQPQLIGSLSKTGISFNDIDIYLNSVGIKNSYDIITHPPINLTALKDYLKFVLACNGSVEDTDWNGWYFNDTRYGNIDVFFDISEFDY